MRNDPLLRSEVSCELTSSRPRFPDYELPDHTKTPRRLSDLQGDDPMVLVLSRGAFCPKDRVHHHELVQFYPALVVGFTRIATITCDDWHTTNNMRRFEANGHASVIGAMAGTGLARGG